MGTHKPVVCGIIGCGVIGPIHAECFRMIDGVSVAWACDLVKEKAAVMARKYAIPHVTTRYEEVLDDPEVECIAVCTDHGSHAEISCAALAAGKHVLCEKALAHNREALDAMLRAHRGTGLVFSGVLQHRFDAINREVKRVIEEGLLGTILTCSVELHCWRSNEYYTADSWRGTWKGEGGAVLINQAIHFIDIAVWLMGGATLVSGRYANRTHGDSIEAEDTAAASVQYSNGALGTIVASSSTETLPWDHRLYVTGSNGAIELRNGRVAAAAFNDAKVTEEITGRLKRCEEHEQSGIGKSYYGTHHPSQAADFIGAVRNGRTPFVGAADARHCVDIVLGIYESHRKSAVVRI
jgi:UDP-N-acetyl-2-amino-2-deoxyglucuronate dehydrogenase